MSTGEEPPSALRFRLFRSQNLREQHLKYADIPLSGEDWAKGISAASALNLGVIAS